MPPAPSSSTPGVASPSRDTVVLVATMPARPSSTARSAISSTSASDRSGAILTSTGVGVSARTAARIGRSDSTACRSRSPGVFGELTLTTRNAASGPTSRALSAVVVDGVLGRGDLGLADVDPDRHVRRVPRQPQRQLAGAVVVEAHPVEQRAVVGQPEHPRRRVAGLRLRGDGADLGVAEAQRAPGVQPAAVLVEAGRQAERAGETHPEHRAGQHRIVRRQPPRQRTAQRGGPR